MKLCIIIICVFTLGQLFGAGSATETEMTGNTRASPIDGLAAPSAPGGQPALPGAQPALPGGMPTGPIMMLGSFQAVMAPMDPAMIAAIMNGASGAGNIPGLIKPPGTKK